MKKKLFVLFMIIFCFLTITTVTAVDTDNSNETKYASNEIKELSTDNFNSNNNNNQIEKQTKEKISIEEKVSNEDYGDDCCTSIIQGYDNDSALSFRRDSEEIVTINVKHNSTFIKQSKASGTYFFHVLISKDGWFVGNGGTDSAETSHSVENYALQMISNKKISTTYLNKIVNLKTKSKLGHFIIKAPNGTYSLMTKFKGNFHKENGILKAGDYIVLPNSPQYFHKGNYIKYTGIKSIVSASRMLNARDAYSSLRHDIITYYYNPAAYAKVKITASNDDGHHAGKKSAKYVDSIQTNTNFISSTSIPKIDNWIDIDEVYLTYKRMKTQVIVNDLVTNNNTITLKALVNDQFGNPVNEGKISFILNNKSITNSNGNVSYFDVKNGIASYKYTLNNLKTNLNLSYVAKYIDNTKYYMGISNLSVIKFDILDFKTEHAKTIPYNNNLTIKTQITYKNNNTPVTEGTVYYKINDQIIKNSKGNTIYSNLKNGTTRFNLQFNKQYKPDTYKLTTIYKIGENNISQDTKITIVDSNNDITVVTKDSNNHDGIAILNATIYDKNGTHINEGKISFIIDGRNLINSKGETILFNIKNGSVTFNYKIPNIWNTTNITYTAIYHKNNTNNTISSYPSTITFDILDFKTEHAKTIPYNNNLTIKTQITYKNNNTPVTEGTVYYKINDQIIKNSKGNTIYSNLKNGTTRFNLQFNKQYKPDTYKLTTIYKIGENNISQDTKITIVDSNNDITVVTKDSNNHDGIAILNATIYDKNGTHINEGKISFIIDGRNLINSKGETILFNIKNGSVTFNYKIPNIWNTTNITYTAIYHKNNTNNTISSYPSTITFDILDFKTEHAKTIPYNNNLTIKTQITYKNNNTPVTEGTVYYKINDQIIKNSKGNTIYSNLKNGTTRFNLQFNKQYKPDTYKLTTIYTNQLYTKETVSFISIVEN